MRTTSIEIQFLATILGGEEELQTRGPENIQI